MHGAKELGLTIQEYFSKPDHVVEGQLRLRKKYCHDFIYAFFYASIEIEAWGGETIFIENGPPNAGKPFILKPEIIPTLTPPNVKESPSLLKVLRAIEALKEKVRDEAPIIGVVMSPFSLTPMQMGLENYLNVIYERLDLFEQLIKINETFTTQWANAQLEAGATAICYFDPIASPTILPREVYLKTGYPVAKRMIANIKGPTVTHMASGRCLPIIDDLIQTGTNIVAVSVVEDLAQLKAACQGKLTLLGNLNGIEMRRWTPEQAESIVKEAIKKAASGGGYILADNHGEIPFQVPDQVLFEISNAVHEWGRYPITIES
jgi:uroporphyrinogen decarboxylase